ncbi:MAG: prepilin-type N-terminal cleavage/methylation domain-containing protein [Desulfuromonadaceae bacterium]|nr:prepilin-type N-terminal cleavage/methylation domain-containing protein [Desulfuromonadaceae bacterium]
MTPLCSTDKANIVWRDARGFTLIEVLIAVTLTSLILTAIYGTFSRLSATQQRLEQSAAVYHQARVLFDRIGRELRGCYLSHSSEQHPFIADTRTDGTSLVQFSSCSAQANDGRWYDLLDLTYRVDKQQQSSRYDWIRTTSRPCLDEDRAQALYFGRNLHALHWRFYDGSNWQENWDSQQEGGLPQRIELELILDDASEQRSFRSAFNPAMAEKRS